MLMDKMGFGLYSYDGLDRLTREVYNEAKVTEYEFDGYNNIQKEYTLFAGITSTKTYAYDMNNRLILTADNYDVSQYSYDDEGNLLQKTTGFGSGVTEEYYRYDGHNRLTEYISDGTTAAYTYNPEGLRETKTVDGETRRFVYAGASVVGEDCGEEFYKYYRGTELIGYEDRTGARRYYRTDAHGDVTGLQDETGETVKTYRYTAYGKEEAGSINPAGTSTILYQWKQETENIHNPFRYTGEYYDEETGFTYLRNRYYDSSVGRFITEDPIKDGVNWYCYANGNPIFFFDPWGLAGEYILNIPEFQHDDTNVPLRDMFNMHSKSIYDTITLVDGGVKVNLNGRSQIYYYDTAKNGSIDGNWMYKGRMIVDAVDFAYRFGLVKEASNSGTMPMIFVLLDGDSKYRSANVEWHFGVNYVNTPIGKVVTWQWFTCDFNAWPEWLDATPSFEATNVITYEGGGNEKRELLFSHGEDYPENIYPAYTLKRYNSRRHVLLPKSVNKAWVRFSAVFNAQIYKQKLDIDLN